MPINRGWNKYSIMFLKIFQEFSVIIEQTDQSQQRGHYQKKK